LFADAILHRTERRGNSKAHVCRPLGEPFWKLAWCHRRISVPSLVVLSTRGARESSKIKSRGFRPFASRKAAGRLLLRTSHVYSCTTTPRNNDPRLNVIDIPSTVSILAISINASHSRNRAAIPLCVLIKCFVSCSRKDRLTVRRTHVTRYVC